MPDTASSRRLDELPAIRARVSQEMAGAAFLLRVVVRGLLGVTGAAERPRGRQLGDRRRGVARVAALMRYLERCVCRLRVSRCVTSRARAASGVVIGVTVLALRDRRRRRERDRRRVTVHALLHRVTRVHEVDGARLRRVTWYRHRHRGRLWYRHLGLLVTRCAARRRSRLMVTDLTAARALERQVAVRRCGRMADEARQLRVPRMREAVGSRGGRRGGAYPGDPVTIGRRRPIGDWSSDPRLRQETRHCLQHRAGRRRRARAAECLRRVERCWCLPVPVRSRVCVASGAVARVDLRLMRHVTRYAVPGRGHLPMRRAHVERDGAPVAVTRRRRAALRRLGRGLLRVWIVAGATFAAVRILCRIEIRECLLHVVAAEALRSARDQRSTCRVGRCEGGDLSRELMAYRAVTDRLTLHLLQHDLRVALLVASTLAAGRASWLEAVNLRAVARHAFHVLERARIRLEVDAVPCRRPDSLPRRSVTGDVTRLAHAIFDRRVRADLVRPLLEPEVELPRAGEHGLCVARMA